MEPVAPTAATPSRGANQAVASIGAEVVADPLALAASGPLEIAILSINYEPELTGIAVYTTGMAEYFAEQGHRVCVHTGFPYYPSWAKRAEDLGRLFSSERRGTIQLRRCYLYVPQRPTALRRILHEFSFTVSASLSYLFSRKAAVTIIVSPPLPLGLPIGLLARLKGSKTVFHVQDLQPDAAVDLGMLPPGFITRLLFAIEKATYLLVDRVSTISGAMKAKIQSKGIRPEKLILFRNWANDELSASGDAASSYRTDWGLGDQFVVLYAGNMGVKQGLELLLEAARQIHAHPDIRFVIVGDGGEKANLQALAREWQLDNVQFRSTVPKENLSRLLATADVSVIPQKPGVKDIVLPSKIGNLLFSERPLIVTADEHSELARLVHEAGAGLVVAPGDTRGFANAILRLKAAPEERRAMGSSGLSYGQAHLRRDRILSTFLTQLRQI